MKQDIRIVQKDSHVINKSLRQKSNLSSQAKDLLAYLLVISENCTICRTKLAGRFKDNEKAMAKGLDELERLCCKKPPAMKIAILTEEPHEFNGFYTRLLVINREDFRIEKSGLRHSSGIFFKLDHSNF